MAAAPPRPPRPPTLLGAIRTLALVALAAIALAAAAAALICHFYWGYILRPPGVDARVLGATHVVGHSVLGYPRNSIAAGDIMIEPPGPIDLTWFDRRRDGDGAWRLLPPSVDIAAWHDDWMRRGVLRDVAPLAPERCRQIPALIKETASLTRGEYGAGFPSAIARIDVYELLGPEGEPLLFIALSTGEISNDHRCYYELLYDDSGPEPRLLDRRHWRYDVAGMEGAEFAGVALVLSILLLVVTLPPTAGFLLWRALSRRHRLARGCCGYCGYDLSGTGGANCPECGWHEPWAKGMPTPAHPSARA